MEIPVALDEINGSEIYWICASMDMAIYAIEMTKLEVNCNLVAFEPGIALNCSVRMISSPNVLFIKFRMPSVP